MNQLKYLVVENAPDVCIGIEERMSAYKEWQAVAFSVSPSDAIDKINHEKPQLIFLDWSLNGGSAYEVLDHINTMTAYSPYIIFNTGFQKDNPEIPQHVFNNYRIDKYIIKPVWEALRNNLQLYLSEAADRFRQTAAREKNVWLCNEKGAKILVDLNSIVCICQHTLNKRLKTLFLKEQHREIKVPLGWEQLCMLLEEHGIDYFITKQRAHVVIRHHIGSFEKPYIRFKGYAHFKVEVVRDKTKAFEEWLLKGDDGRKV